MYRRIWLVNSQSTSRKYGVQIKGSAILKMWIMHVLFTTMHKKELKWPPCKLILVKFLLRLNRGRRNCWPAGPWPVYLRSGQSNWTKIGPLGQLIFSGHLGQQLSFLPCHSISTDNRLMKFPDKTLKFNFNHSPKAINSLITQSACVYLDLLPHVKRILTEIYAGNQYFIIQ